MTSIPEILRDPDYPGRALAKPLPAFRRPTGLRTHTTEPSQGRALAEPLPEYRAEPGLRVHRGWEPTAEQTESALALERGDVDPYSFTGGLSALLMGAMPSREPGESSLAALSRWISQYALPGGVGAAAIGLTRLKSPAIMEALAEKGVKRITSGLAPAARRSYRATRGTAMTSAEREVAAQEALRELIGVPPASAPPQERFARMMENLNTSRSNALTPEEFGQVASERNKRLYRMLTGRDRVGAAAEVEVEGARVGESGRDIFNSLRNLDRGMSQFQRESAMQNIDNYLSHNNATGLAASIETTRERGLGHLVAEALAEAQQRHAHNPAYLTVLRMAEEAAGPSQRLITLHAPGQPYHGERVRVVGPDTTDWSNFSPERLAELSRLNNDLPLTTHVRVALTDARTGMEREFVVPREAVPGATIEAPQVFGGPVNQGESLPASLDRGLRFRERAGRPTEAPAGSPGRLGGPNALGEAIEEIVTHIQGGEPNPRVVLDNLETLGMSREEIQGVIDRVHRRLIDSGRADISERFGREFALPWGRDYLRRHPARPLAEQGQAAPQPSRPSAGSPGEATQRRLAEGLMEPVQSEAPTAPSTRPPTPQVPAMSPSGWEYLGPGPRPGTSRVRHHPQRLREEGLADTGGVTEHVVPTAKLQSLGLQAPKGAQPSAPAPAPTGPRTPLAAGAEISYHEGVYGEAQPGRYVGPIAGRPNWVTIEKANGERLDLPAARVMYQGRYL